MIVNVPNAPDVPETSKMLEDVDSVSIAPPNGCFQHCGLLPSQIQQAGIVFIRHQMLVNVCSTLSKVIMSAAASACVPLASVTVSL